MTRCRINLVFQPLLYLVNLKNTDSQAVIPHFHIYPSDVQISLQVIMSAGRHAELLAACAPTARFGQWCAACFIEGHKPFSDDIYLYSVVSQQGVVQAESCKAVILRHEKKAAS
ncbi:Phage terminase [Pseudomonas syringae pv. actinidiae]|uniref:Phage terminase n=1 Tax=Pseudomonas syringae pv. actinidiae TaxID=103796 RepID=A0AAN4Q6D6_PSESF|nr:Phage terminase [Pseudomonas syringae pv. actinidiae]